MKEGNRLKHRGLSSKAVNVLIEIIKDSRLESEERGVKNDA